SGSGFTGLSSGRPLLCDPLEQQAAIEVLAGGIRLEGQVGHIGAAKVLVEDPVGNANPVVFAKPVDGVVVDHNLADAVHRHGTQQHGDGDHQQGPAGGEAAGGGQGAAHGGVVVLALGAHVAVALELVVGNHHQVGGNKQYGQQPGQKHPDRHEDAEHLHRRDGGQRQGGEGGDGGQRSVEHGGEQGVHHL